MTTALDIHNNRRLLGITVARIIMQLLLNNTKKNPNNNSNSNNLIRIMKKNSMATTPLHTHSNNKMALNRTLRLELGARKRVLEVQATMHPMEVKMTAVEMIEVEGVDHEVVVVEVIQGVIVEEEEDTLEAVEEEGEKEADTVEDVVVVKVEESSEGNVSLGAAIESSTEEVGSNAVQITIEVENVVEIIKLVEKGSLEEVGVVEAEESVNTEVEREETTEEENTEGVKDQEATEVMEAVVVEDLVAEVVNIAGLEVQGNKIFNYIIINKNNFNDCSCCA